MTQRIVTCAQVSLLEPGKYQVRMNIKCNGFVSLILTCAQVSMRHWPYTYLLSLCLKHRASK